MASKKASISVAIIAEATKAKAGFAEAEKAAGSFGTQMGNLTKTIAATFATKAIIDFAKSSISAASDLGESINAVEVTFGEAADGILRFGETASKTVGMSAEQYNSFAVQFAGFTQQIAGDQGDIAGVTADLTTRIADFASVMNLDIPQAAQIFQSTLAGQSEPIRRFGIDMSAAAVGAFAVEQGISDSATTMSASEKVQATYLKLMEDTAKVAGDFGNTSDSLANSQRILQADFSNLQAEIGEALLPIMEQLVGIARFAIDAFLALPKPVQTAFAASVLAGGAFLTASKALQGFGMAASTANKALGAVGLVLTAAVGIYSLYNRGKQEAAQRTSDFVAALNEEASSQTNAVEKHIASILAAEDLSEIYTDLGLSIQDVSGIIQGESNPIFEELETIVGRVRSGQMDLAMANKELGDRFGISFAQAKDFVGQITEQESALAKAREEVARNEAAQEGLGIETDRARAATEAATQATQEQTDALNAVLTATLAQFNATLAYEDQQWRTTDAIDAYTQAQIDAFTGTTEGEEAARAIAEAQNDAAQAALSQAAAAARLAEDQAEASGSTLTAAESARIQQEELQKVADSLAPDSPLRQQLESYITDLTTKIPDSVATELNVKVNAWLDTMQAGGGAAGGRLTFRAKGGPVSPTMGPYIVGEEGPEVFIPGQTGMILPNTALIDAMAARPTAAGVTTQPMVVVNVQGSVTSERDLVESIRRGLVDAQRSGSKLVYSNI